MYLDRCELQNVRAAVEGVLSVLPSYVIKSMIILLRGFSSSGSAFFHGPWFVHPIEVEHSPTRLFYKHEVFRSSIEDTNPMLSIQGKCAVLVHKDYCISRPTELPEHDIYICESKYMEAEKSIRKLAKSMKVSAACV